MAFAMHHHFASSDRVGPVMVILKLADIWASAPRHHSLANSDPCHAIGPMLAAMGGLGCHQQALYEPWWALPMDLGAVLWNTSCQGSRHWAAAADVCYKGLEVVHKSTGLPSRLPSPRLPTAAICLAHNPVELIHEVVDGSQLQDGSLCIEDQVPYPGQPTGVSFMLPS